MIGHGIWLREMHGFCKRVRDNVEHPPLGEVDQPGFGVHELTFSGHCQTIRGMFESASKVRNILRTKNYLDHSSVTDLKAY